MWTHRFFKDPVQDLGTEYKAETLYSGTKAGVYILGTQSLNTALVTWQSAMVSPGKFRGRVYRDGPVYCGPQLIALPTTPTKVERAAAWKTRKPV